MRKADHAHFLQLLDESLRVVGGVKAVDSSIQSQADCAHIPATTTYTFNTIHGPLTLTPDVPYKSPSDTARIKYDLTVYGRFAGLGPYPDAASRSGNWNFHYGERAGAEVDSAVETITASVKRILVAAA